MKKLGMLLIVVATSLAKADMQCTITGLAEQPQKYEFSAQNILGDYSNGETVGHGDVYGMLIQFPSNPLNQKLVGSRIDMWFMGVSGQSQKIGFRFGDGRLEAEGIILGNKQIKISCRPTNQ